MLMVQETRVPTCANVPSEGTPEDEKQGVQVPHGQRDDKLYSIYLPVHQFTRLVGPFFLDPGILKDTTCTW